MFRLFDIILSGVALVILSPLLVPLSVILRLTGEGEVFYRQLRVGFRGERFNIYKFATMLRDSPNIGAGTLTMRNDPRVLPVGAFLRKTKINELPQILNIIIGDLSIVGPRPQMQVDFEKYSDDVQKRIYNVRPGLTGIGSVVFRDEESIFSLAAENENPHDFYKRVIAPYKGELEIWYQKHRSIYLDFQLIFITAWAIVSPETRVYEKWFKDLPTRQF